MLVITTVCLLAFYTDVCSFRPSQELHLGPLLCSLMLIALLLERALEVFLTNLRAPTSETLQEEVRAMRNVLRYTKLKVERTELEEALKAKEAKLAGHKRDTRRYALHVGLGIGLLISIAGVRTLESILVIAPAAGGATWAQAGMMRALDILLTGALIAGGSDGIHKLAEAFRTTVEGYNRQSRR